MIFVSASANRAAAEPPDCFFTASPQPMTAGATGSVWLCCMNGSTNDMNETFQPNLDGVLTGAGDSSKVALHLTNTAAFPAVIPPGKFMRQEYTFEIPPGFAGPVVLEVSNYNAIVLQVQNAPAKTSAAEKPATAQPAAKNLSSMFAGFLGRHIFPYEPIYFLLGTYPAAEFQFSLKYKLMDLDSGWNPLGHAYFAYTQVSYWDLISKDPSFYDTSYKPSGFLLYEDINRGKIFHLDLQGGVEHESNGRGGTAERSLNTVYLQPAFKFDLPAGFQLSLQPRAWEYLSLGSNNPDLPEYHGYADLRAALNWTDAAGYQKIQLATRFRIGDHGEHEGWMFDLRFNLPRPLHFNPSIDLQYFTGYGQTLRQYNQFSTGFRAGLCLWY